LRCIPFSIQSTPRLNSAERAQALRIGFSLQSVLLLTALGFAQALCVHVAVADSLGPIEIVAPAENTGAVFQVGDVPVGEFTGNYEIIEQEELQQSGSSLAEIIAESPGVQFRQSGGAGSFSSVSLRGSTAEQVNVYLDGLLLNEAAGGGVNLSHIELMQADRVEIYRGAVPVQLGHSAIGGAVNITTHRATSEPAVRLLSGFGSFGAAKLAASYAGPLQWLNQQSLVASFTHRRTNNDFPFLNDNGTELNPDDDTRERRHNAGSESTSGFLKSGFAISGNHRLEQLLQIDRHQQGVANWHNSASADASLTTDNFQWRATLGHSGPWNSRLRLHYTSKRELFDDSNGTVGLGVQRNRSTTNTFGGGAYWERVREDNSLALNITARVESLETLNALRNASPTEARRLRTDLNLQWSRFYASGESLFAAGLSGFTLRDDYTGLEAQIPASRYQADTLGPHLGLNHALGKVAGGRAGLISNVSLQKRAPSFFELFGSQGFFEGNANLSVETARNVDLGLEWVSGASAGIDATLQATWFHYRKTDLISRVYNARGVGRSENISAADGQGVELSALLAFDNGIAVDANLTLQDSVNRSIVRGFIGKQLPGEAAVDASMSVRWQNPSWKLAYTLNLLRDKFYDSANLLPAADQTIHSVGMSRYYGRWRLSFELNNIGNDNYEDFNGYPKPGRSGFFSVFYQP
jgi:iron complex outermembrane receptor protein